MGNKQKFFSQLQSLYVGAKLDGKGGMAKLLQFKCQYFEKIQPLIESEIKQRFPDNQASGLTELYDKLYTFFSSYLTDGGSIYFNDTPAYKNVYAKVYFDKEDTALFYKTKDLYYVKSQVMYQSVENLTFKHEDKAINIYFDFDAGDYIPTTNNTKEKVLILFTGVKNGKPQFKVIEESQLVKGANNADKVIIDQLKDVDEAKLYVIKQSANQLFDETVGFYALNFAQNKETREAALKFLDESGLAINEEIINKAINIYKKQNEVDFFIHKNAKGFLTEQFNLYMYNYLSNDMDSLLEQSRLDTIRKIKEVAHIVIDYIAKFEDELKAIWNKPKFVRKSNYVVTLDKLIDKNFDISILTNHKGMDEQVKEWYDLGIIGEAFNVNEVAQTQDMFDSKYKYLPFDTKHFDDEVKYKILALFDNLDEECDGVLIKSDNYQALNTTMPKYRELIDLIYIDPPFNTGSDFYYNDNYQDSTWCSIMWDRLNLSKAIMSDKGSIYVHLDSDANYYNRVLMNDIFGNEYFNNEIVWCYDKWVSPSKNLQRNHDTIYKYSISNNFIFNVIREIDEKRQLTLDRGYTTNLLSNGETQLIVYNGSETKENIQRLINSGRFTRVLYSDPTGNPLKDYWRINIAHPKSGERIGYSTQKPEELLERVLKVSSNQNSLVCDFFAGSGTTLAVAHKLNRKWLGIEMGGGFSTTYFDDGEQKIGNIGRMKLVLFGHKVGISKNQEVKMGGLFKYYELEQYEDVLDKAVYNYSGDNLSNLAYDFSNNEKLAHNGLTIDYTSESNAIYYSFERLYPDVDIWETISNFYGYKIKQYLSKDQVVFVSRDGRELTLSRDKVTFDNMPELKQLIWW